MSAPIIKKRISRQKLILFLLYRLNASFVRYRSEFRTSLLHLLCFIVLSLCLFVRTLDSA